MDFRLVGSKICNDKFGCVTPKTVFNIDPNEKLTVQKQSLGSPGENWQISPLDPYMLVNDNTLCLTVGRSPLTVLYQQKCVVGNVNQQFIFVD